MYQKNILITVIFFLLLGKGGTTLFGEEKGELQGSPEKLKVGFAKENSCKKCHQEAFDSYLNSTHSIKINPKTPASENSCQSCHGPGQAHVESKGEIHLLDLSRKSSVSAKEKNQTCLNCHQGGNLEHWSGSIHQLRGNACIDCHNPHSGNAHNLRKATQTETCLQCHKQVKSELNQMSHHPLREGKMECADCHNPHGTIEAKLVDAEVTNQKCYECHAEHRGPFLWEHAPVTESCLNCHKPHGSSHKKLLTSKEPFLCQKCHSNSRHPGTAYARDASKGLDTYGGGLSNRIYYRGCLNCHGNTHGSNHPSGKSLLR